MIKVKKLHPDAQLPVRNKEDDAGSDVFSVEQVIIPAGGRRVVSTGIAIQCDGWNDSNDVHPIKYRTKSYIRIAPRSGMAAKNGIDVLAGVVDIIYTGEIKVILHNTDSSDYVVGKGEKIAQIIREVCILDEFQEVDELDETDRNAAGFGSSGK